MTETTNFGFTKYSYAVRGWESGVNGMLQGTTDEVASTAAKTAEVSAQLAENTTLLDGVAQPLGYNLGFDVWQRGTSFTGSAAVPTADLWWKNEEADVTRQTAPASFNSDYVAQVAKKAGSVKAALIRIGIPFPGRYHSQMRFFRNRAVTVAVDVLCGTASEARIALHDGVSRSYSDYHTGGGARERLVLTKTLSPYASEVVLECWVDGAGTATSGQFGNGMVAVGTFAALPYTPRHPQEDELACQAMYQKITFGTGWGDRPETHQEKISVVHPTPMMDVPSRAAVVRGPMISPAGSLTLAATTDTRYATVVLATGLTKGPGGTGRMVAASPNTLTLELDYVGIGTKVLAAGYEVP